MFKWTKKRNIALLLIMVFMMLFVTGCDNVDVSENQNGVEAQAVEETKKPGRPREDLDVEIAEGIYAIQGLMRVHFIDVGQADSTFIELGNGQTMLIDAGLGGDDVVKYIRELQYSDIDFVVATHPHDDHIGGMATVLDSFDIGKMYMPRQEHTISAFTNMLDVIENKNIELHEAKAGVNITTSGIIKIDILAPFAESYSNLNNCSAVVKLTYGETVMLFTGDAEQVIETQLLNSDIDADVLKVGHHGAGSSSAPSFIKAVSPEIAVISCGRDNSYGHPDYETLAILNEVGADIYRTDEQGTIQVTADQHKKITVDKKASTVKENAPPTENNGEQEENNDNSVINDNQSEVVYRTNTGKKYHRSGCSYLKSKIETTVSEAQAMGLGPCSGCNPPR
ncbi:MAG: MBL fold metallo-hydrolase [Clostridia bacterium]|nr:MBL fold metallo-hydrolase [Clostridia bacterium]